jgi:hypothetical protein
MTVTVQQSSTTVVVSEEPSSVVVNEQINGIVVSAAVSPSIETIASPIVKLEFFGEGPQGVIGPQGEKGINLDETAKIDGSVVYYDAASSKFKADATVTTNALTDITYRLNSDHVGTSSSAAQSFMGISPILEANTTYRFHASFLILKTTGPSSHSVGILFGGDCTVNNIYALVFYHRQASTSTSLAMSTYTPQSAYITDFNTNLVLTSNFSSSGHVMVFNITGTVSIDVGGTFDMKYKLSAAPGGAYSTKAGSFIEIWPIGTGDADVSVGSWA